MQLDQVNMKVASASSSTCKNQSITFEIECCGIIGVYDHERFAQQKLIFIIHCSFDSYCYLPIELITNLKMLITREVTRKQPRLLEKMAFHVAQTIVNNFPAINKLVLTIKKPSAMQQAKCAFVTVSMNEIDIEPITTQ